eukprot:475426-Amphidinium_carterae.1
MPTSTYTNEEVMQRIVTVLIHNIDERWRTAPMKTVDIQKEIGLTGNQIKSKQAVMDALMMLERQKVVYKVFLHHTKQILPQPPRTTICTIGGTSFGALSLGLH